MTNTRQPAVLAVSVYALLTLTLLLSACTRQATRPDVNSVSAGVESKTETPIQRPGTSLRIKAAAWTDEGKYEQAGRLLERALRVDARDPATYYEFARLRLLQGQHQQARQLNEKGLSLQPGTALKRKLKTLATRIDEVDDQAAPVPASS